MPIDYGDGHLIYDYIYAKCNCFDMTAINEEHLPSCPLYIKKELDSLNLNMGWTCPSCGHSYAPWVYKCDNCPKTYTTTSTNSNEGE